MNTFDWLAQLDIQDTSNDFDLVEVSFKNGARKDFYHNPPSLHAYTGDSVLVEVPGGGGYDIGKISLSGDLVRLQIKKKEVKDGSLFLNVIRKANERDVEKLNEIRANEREAMVKARVIARTLDLDMKLGDVEFQGDGRKATFFYTADGRVDFRELIRHYAKDFKVKIEMRQIGARQESTRLGGIGSCGRELCCSTWLSDFKSVSTAAARYQQLAINQAKLSGMCGRLKCCLNYELDTYLEALEEFPQNPERLKTKEGVAVLIKTDVFKGIMVYAFDSGPERGKFYTLGVSDVKNIISMNKRGEYPDDFKDMQFVPSVSKNSEDDDDDEEDDDVDVDYGGELVGAIELPDEKRRKKKKKKKRPFERDNEPRNNPNQRNGNGNNSGTGAPRKDPPAPKSDGSALPQSQQPPRDDNTPKRDFREKPKFKDNRPPFNKNKKDNNDKKE
jgi:cell fate regulator YaaT (PSP1 superfamily)